jgi:hypothetical protein
MSDSVPARRYARHWPLAPGGCAENRRTTLFPPAGPEDPSPQDSDYWPAFQWQKRYADEPKDEGLGGVPRATLTESKAQPDATVGACAISEGATARSGMGIVSIAGA